MRELVFLKLGGSLITDKTRPYTVRMDRLDALMGEIKSALAANAELQLLLGHGSGSFGHFAVKDHLEGLKWSTPSQTDKSGATDYWRGYAEVWYRAAELNHHVMEAMHRAGIPAMALQPSAMVKALDGSVAAWDLTSVRAALETALTPVIYGDIVVDAVRGSTVFSTEALMSHLAPELRPRRILLAGIEAGVWADYPKRKTALEQITPKSYAGVAGRVGESHGVDVTGGMKAKVEEMLELVGRMPGLSVQIFSGEQRGNIAQALAGARLGTILVSD